MPLRVVVTGGRSFSDRARVYEILDGIHSSGGIDLLMEGGATGVDALARDWATTRGVANKTYTAPWQKLGKKAGPVRNSWMLSDGEPDMVVACPGGAGTADCVAKARRMGVLVAVVPALPVPENAL